MTDAHNIAQVEQAKKAAMSIRHDGGSPVRVFERDGRIIWSRVDDDMRDLTIENSDGLLYHVSSVFVPHGSPNPLDRTDNALVEVECARYYEDGR